MSPLPQQPQYGDAAKLEQLATGTKQTNGTSGPTIQRTPVGRPEGTTGIPAPRQSGQDQMSGVTPELKEKYKAIAQAEWVAQFWQMMAQRFPGPRTEYYAAAAERMKAQAAEGVYNSTANFEF